MADAYSERSATRLLDILLAFFVALAVALRPMLPGHGGGANLWVEMCVFIAAMCWLVRMAMARRLRIVFTGVGIPLAVLLAIAGFSTLRSPHQAASVSTLLEWVSYAALFLVRRTLRDILLSARHSLVLRSRHSQRIRALSRLHATASALAGSLPPPPGRCCLNANEEGVFYLVHSDGRELRGGAVPAIPDERLPLLYQPGSEINAQATRALLRAWARRSRSEPDPRQPVQRRWAGSDQAGEAIVRWMVARNRLRALLLLLERAMR